MLTPVSEMFLESVLKQIVWRGEHASIREELTAHLEDHIQMLMEKGMEPSEAEREAVASMGDPREIGRQLSRQHRPFLGWAVRFTGVAVKVLACVVGLFAVLTAVNWVGGNYRTLLGGAKMDAGGVPLIWEAEVNQRQTMDNRTVTLQKIAYTQKGDLLILGTSRLHLPYRQGWSYSAAFTSILDEKGREYRVGSSLSGGGIFQLKIHDFPSDATRLTMIYDQYNRYMEFRLELPQEGGDPL